MKIEKNKIVFASVIVIVVIFIVAYSTLVLMGGEKATDYLDQPTIPVLNEEGETYNSKVDALNDLKEVRESNIPSIYSEKLLDSLGVYDPQLEEKEKDWLVDSIYARGEIDYEEMGYREELEEKGDWEQFEDAGMVEDFRDEPLSTEGLEERNFSDEHLGFFDFATPQEKLVTKESQDKSGILAEVNGNQEIKANDRLELMLAQDAVFNGVFFPKNKLLYGFASFQSNRVFIKITHIDHVPVDLKAYDLQDGNEGVYVENSFRSEATREVLDDVIQDINIAGLPQIGGIKNIFRRNNRNIKITILDQYQLLLKP